MTPNKLRGEIEQLLKLLIEADIAVYINPVVMNNASGGYSRITWGSSNMGIGEAFRSEFCTLDDYSQWLELSAYSAVLYDGSVIQMTYDFSGSEFVGHRLAYYPCPFDIDQELLRTEPILDVISIYRGNTDSLVKLRSPLRFDYDNDAKAEMHPAVHLTLLWNHCRWAVACPLSPGHFIRFLFRHFYPSIWSVHEFIRKWPQERCKRTIESNEETHLHIAWT